MHDVPSPAAGRVPLIIRPHILESLDWFRYGTTTRAATQPDEECLCLAARLPELAGFGPAAVAVGEQVHGDVVRVVGGLDTETEAPRTGEVIVAHGADALVTQEPNLAVGVFTADCVPVLLVDRRTRAFGVAHAGREGTLRGIVGKTVRKLGRLGSRPEDLLVWVAPSVSAMHYEVSDAIAADFRDHFGHYPGAIQGSNLRHLALGVINWCELVACGVPREQIELDARCTFERGDLFFSYRRDGAATGRMITFGFSG